MNIFIGGSSLNDIDPKYLSSCKEFLEVLFSSNDELISGAMDSGIMGLAYHVALKKRISITGIAPEIYKDDFNLLNCNNEIITKNISERIEVILSNSDVFVFLPGGTGTIHELLSVVESKRSREFNKPIIIFNVSGFFDEFINFLDKLYNEKFLNQTVKESYFISDNIYDILRYIKEYNY